MNCDYSFSFLAGQRQRFRDGELVREWRTRYPNLFDDDDQRVLKTSQQRRYHFLEWLSAVLLFESMGYLSLVEKYTSKSHPQKQGPLRKCLTQELEAWLYANESGQPDLFVYSSNHSEWFFCEVKGPGDRIRRNQHDWSARFEAFLLTKGISSNRRLRVLCLHEIDA